MNILATPTHRMCSLSGPFSGISTTASACITFYCCFDFDRTTFELQPDLHWANSTGYLRAMMQGFIERLYPYTGDRAHASRSSKTSSTTNWRTASLPRTTSGPQVPYASANPGAQRYTGWSQHGEDYIEPHVVGEDGYAYLRLYEMTGNTKYLARRDSLRRRPGQKLTSRR